MDKIANIYLEVKIEIDFYKKLYFYKDLYINVYMLHTNWNLQIV